ncbi:hypothetical protein [Rhodococcus opacus]|uniref:hypothetical protein n=1 Tax=Rhodococcus opacus TaxID=37919 RepID=UPI0002A45490|nr:hypothetical protein [Rhodococcus opacus]ELB87662.1 hypothetical protein Rwratislav_38693 [Rhodococcus wratislaviensis IFP 2016]MDX5964957.1 transposase [Rhodococcus opacus]NKY76873.1 transposase [Rhodococcus opacus]UNN01565.1 transposase [Rhodococcus opacus]UZG52465.1 transposase [Rhodococcus opacus]
MRERIIAHSPKPEPNNQGHGVGGRADIDHGFAVHASRARGGEVDAPVQVHLRQLAPTSTKQLTVDVTTSAEAARKWTGVVR